MDSEKNAYKQILKATSLFGGVQFLNIIISVIKTKVVALILGPSGIGILTLLNTSLNVLGSATGFGLDSSGIKSISESLGIKNDEALKKKILIFKKLILFTGVFGALITLVFSPYLSQIAFGSKDFTVSFIWLSLAVLFRQITQGYLTILESLSRLRLFAKSNLFANFAALIVTLPMYLYWGFDAIAPAIVASTFISFVFSYFYVNPIYKSKEKIAFKPTFVEGKEMIYLGMALGLSGLTRTLSEYLVQTGISFQGGIDEVGFYGAGLLILNSYVGIIFLVMSKNYFPKLSLVCNENDKIKKLTFQQAFISIVLITVIIIFFIIFAPLLVKLLFSEKFSSIVLMISIGVLGMLFKAISWSLGYIIIAKGDSRVFIKTSLGFSSLYLIMLLSGYYLFQLNGVGIAFSLYYLFHFIGIKIIVENKYGISLNSEIYNILFKCLVICLVVFSLSFLEKSILKHVTMAVAGVLSLIYLFYIFNKKVPIREFLMSFNKKSK
ncbi:oligosaccharide flippase family protein [Hwangdonia seohaensis]|uniref:Oligosaccharide flippase family protein n=1 Tax=Hwangdonia seohaensis TaxID=1240727 RepID=A0ABW3RG67_9FLAO|nr:oligosaccharide flippase family protein [Hwangdonia seohaensis]